MERVSEERFVGGMLRGRLVKGKRESVSTSTPSSRWRLVDLTQSGISGNPLLCRNMSARKLGADLWESYPVGKMDAVPIFSNKRDKCSEVPIHMTDTPDAPAAQVTPYNHSDSASSMGTSTQTRELGHRVITSAKMGKVVNRIHSPRARLKELLIYKQRGVHEVKGMLEKVEEDNFSRKCRSLSAVEALKGELDDERRCRKHLERLNRKLAQEMMDVNCSVSSTLKQIEKERRSRKLLENLCDEFAEGILNWQSEFDSVKQQRLKKSTLILHTAEVWLEKRIQSKQDQDRFINRSLLGFKTNGDLWSCQEESCHYRRSSESVLLNEAAHQIPVDEDNSTENELNCFEQNKTSTSRRSDGSSIGTGKPVAKNSGHMVKDLIRKYSGGINERKTQTSGTKPLSTGSSSPMQQLGSKLTTTPVYQKQHSLARRSEAASFGSHLLEARKLQRS